MNKKDFEAMMEEINKELRAKNVPIHARPIHAVGEAAKCLKTDVILAPLPAAAIEGHCNKLSLAAHIYDWYESRYGDRLKIHFGPGSVVLLIRGDPWRIVLPRIFGVVTVTCDPDLKKYRNASCVSILNCIEDFPAGLAAKLTPDERKEILLLFTSSLDTLQQLEGITDKPYIKEAIADLESAVSQVFARPPQYGLSKWSSLQFVEKLLKSFLELKKAKVPRHHGLAKIAQEAQSVGLGSVNSDLLSKVQCSAGVRYGEVPVTLEEAIAVHHATLYLCRQLVPNIKQA